MELKKEYTSRGFGIYQFEDDYRQICTLQKSSSINDHIWLGVSNTGPLIRDGSGNYNSDDTSRMHLTPEQVKALLPILKKFVKTGEI